MSGNVFINRFGVDVMKNKLKLGIDIDGTVTQPESMIPFLNESFHKQIKLDDIQDYNLLPLLNISEQEFWSWMNENEEKIYAVSPLAPHAKHILTEWKSEYELHYISARRDHLHAVTLEWFTKNEIPYDHIELVGKHDKVETVSKFQIDLFFEDNHSNACTISESCNIPVLLFDTPYNRKPVPNHVFRVKNWQEAETWVKAWSVHHLRS